MHITYTWTVRSLRKRPIEGFEDVVCDVEWSYTGTSNSGLSYERWGATAIPEPSEGEFIPYADLTESVVISWLESQISTDSLKMQIANQLALLDNPPEEVPFDRLPWVAQG